MSEGLVINEELKQDKETPRPRRKRERQSSSPSTSPEQLSQPSCEAVLNDLNAKVDKLLPVVTQIEKLQKQVEKLLKEKTELKKAIEFNNYEITELKKSVKTLQEKQSDMASFAATTGVQLVKTQTELDKQIARNIKLEAYTRRSNIMVYGVEDNKSEDTTEVFRKTLVGKLKIPKHEVDNLRLERVHRITSRTRHGTPTRPRPIIARFSFFQEKKALFKYVKNLKGTSVSIADDYPYEINNIRRKLQPVFKAAKQANKTAFFNVDRLIIDGEVYRGEETKDLPYYGKIM